MDPVIDEKQDPRNGSSKIREGKPKDDLKHSMEEEMSQCASLREIRGQTP